MGRSKPVAAKSSSRRRAPPMPSTSVRALASAALNAGMPGLSATDCSIEWNDRPDGAPLNVYLQELRAEDDCHGLDGLRVRSGAPRSPAVPARSVSPAICARRGPPIRAQPGQNLAGPAAWRVQPRFRGSDPVRRCPRPRRQPRREPRRKDQHGWVAGSLGSHEGFGTLRKATARNRAGPAARWTRD